MCVFFAKKMHHKKKRNIFNDSQHTFQKHNWPKIHQNHHSPPFSIANPLGGRAKAIGGFAPRAQRWTKRQMPDRLVPTLGFSHFLGGGKTNKRNHPKTVKKPTKPDFKTYVVVLTVTVFLCFMVCGLAKKKQITQKGRWKKNTCVLPKKIRLQMISPSNKTPPPGATDL